MPSLQRDISSDAEQILGSITDAFMAFDAEWRFTYINDRSERIMARTREDLLGHVFWDEFPATVGSIFEREYRRAVTEQTSVTFEEFYPPLNLWVEVRAYPSGGGLAVFYQDVTERAERERRERFLAGLAERARGLTDPDEVIADAVDSVGRFLGVSRCIFADIDIEIDTCTIRPDYRSDPASPSIEGIVSIASFGPYVVTEYAARRAVAVNDTHNDPIKAPPESIAAYDAIGIRAHVTVPVVHTGRVVSCMSVHNSTPRHWQPEEIELLRTVVERTWLTVEVLRQQQALVREAEQRQTAYVRTTAILESITDAFFALDTGWNFTYLNDHAERLLRPRDTLLERNIWEEIPAALGTTFDRECHRAVADQVVVSFEEYYQPPLDAWFEVRAYPSSDGLSVYFHDISERKAFEAERERLADTNRLLLNSTGDGIYGIDGEGRFTFVNGAAAQMLGYSQDEMLGRNGHRLIHHTRLDGTQYPEGECPIYRSLCSGGVAHIEEDVFWRADGTAFPVAYSASPILDDGTVRGVVVTFSDISERRAQEAERQRLAERERKIASQLQAALQPELPGSVPGLALTKYYDPALADEAGVGGDFYDVFPVDKGCTALIVGDLSGKGLAAAAQVATVRNMLRAFLYSKPTVSEAVTDLNRVLAENNLLTGFTTLYVSVYDSGTRRLNYVNCGQEPALLRRAATGEVEQLVPTGPILGSIENAQYDEKTVTLNSGDALAIFSDGLTEVGPRRTAMLGIEGVTDLLGQPIDGVGVEGSEAMAEYLTRCLIAGVDAAAAGGVMRDDVCLLVAVAE